MSGTSLPRVVTLQRGHFPRVSTIHTRVEGLPVLGFLLTLKKELEQRHKGINSFLLSFKYCSLPWPLPANEIQLFLESVSMGEGHFLENVVWS